MVITSLGDFVKELAALLHKEKVEMPFEKDCPWHELFYELKSLDREGKPPFFKSLRFDWDGPYPKSRELKDFLHALHWNASVSASNPRFHSISIPNGIAEMWLERFEQIPREEEKEFMMLAFSKAREKFQAAEI